MAGALGVKLGPKIALHAVISCDDAAACGKVAASLDARRRAVASEMGTRLTGFSTVLEQLEIKPEVRPRILKDNAARLLGLCAQERTARS